ncbi:MAG: MFS transporter [Candidatus Hodarchaeota archaeon]
MNEELELGVETEVQSNRHSKKTYLSFGMYQISWTIIISTYNVFLFYYYHTVIGLEAWVIFLATAFTTVWASLNDPLIGYITDRNFKWTKRWGRRFPWIVLGALPWCFSLILIFSAPDASINPWPAFFWFIFSQFIFELFITLSDVNVGILRVDKFRTETERRIYSGYFGPLDMIAQVFGMTIPPLLIFTALGSASYTVMAILVAVIAFIFMLLFLPSAREDKIIIDRYFFRDYERISFFKGLGSVLKQKSFLGFWIIYATFLIATTIMTAMIPYLATFLLQVGPDMITVLFAIFLTGALISVPVWLKMLKKFNNNKKVYTIGGFILSGTLVPISLFTGIIDVAIYMFIVGFAMGSIWAIGIPVIQANVQDDFVVRTGKNQKGVLVGVGALLGIFTAFIDELIIAIVYGITGFSGGIEDYAELVATVANVDLVLWGIRFLLGIIPMVIMLTGTIIFWKIYPLTQDKVMENKAKLQELGF